MRIMAWGWHNVLRQQACYIPMHPVAWVHGSECASSMHTWRVTLIRNHGNSCRKIFMETSRLWSNRDTTRCADRTDDSVEDNCGMPWSKRTLEMVGPGKLSYNGQSRLARLQALVLFFWSQHAIIVESRRRGRFFQHRQACYRCICRTNTTRFLLSITSTGYKNYHSYLSIYTFIGIMRA